MSEETNNRTNDHQSSLPLIVLEDAVVFPHTIVSLPLDEVTAAAADAVNAEGKLVLLVARREDADADVPLALQLHRVGVIARVEQVGGLRNGGRGIVVRGVMRATPLEQVQHSPYPRFTFEEHPDVVEKTPELDTLMMEVHAAIDAVLDLRQGVPQEIRNFVRSIDDPGHLADNTGYSPEYTFAERQDLLETFDVSSVCARYVPSIASRLTVLGRTAAVAPGSAGRCRKAAARLLSAPATSRDSERTRRGRCGSAGLDDLRNKLLPPRTARNGADGS